MSDNNDIRQHYTDEQWIEFNKFYNGTHGVDFAIKDKLWKINIILFDIDFSFSPRSLGILAFFKTDAELEKYKNDGTLKKIEQIFDESIEECKLRPDKRTKTYYEFDTDETVQREWGGDYEKRLR